MPTSLSRSNIASFEILVRKVKETLALGRKRVKQEIVHAYWKIGKDIHKHILNNEDRANYGEEVFPKLSKRVDMSVRSLQEMHKVYLEFPKITRSSAQLDWTHLRTLASISNKQFRDEFAGRAIEEGWDTRKLKSKIKAKLRSDSVDGKVEIKENEKDYSLITRPKLGTLYTYRLVTTPAANELKIDKGFSDYTRSIDLRAKLKEGDIAESVLNQDGSYSAVKSNRTKDDLFTYIAYVERVVDGDTLFVEIEQGFKDTTRQYLRLRALDAWELKFKKGQEAKDLVVSLLRNIPFIFLTTTHSDKYDRYLADVFIPGKTFLKEWEAGTAVLSQSSDLLYLNNELLSHKHAWRVKY